MATARELIEGSLRLLNVLATGETSSNEEAVDSLAALNDMMDSWAAEGAFVHATVREEFSLVAGTASYTLGSGATFSTTRPIEIVAATIETQGSSPQEYLLELLTAQQWADVTDKAATSDVPSKLYVEGTFPNDTLNFWPVPSATNKLALYSRKPLTRFASLSTSVSLPPGYSRALRYNLAVELAPEFGRSPAAEVVAIAAESKANIFRKNLEPVYMDPELPAGMARGASIWRVGE
jgi:hypothetical protein